MSVFTTNQNRQFYVAKSYKTGIDAASEIGAIEVKTIGDGVNKELFFTYKGADTILRSDRILLKNLDYVKGIAAADMAMPLKSVKVSLSEDVNEGKPISGQDYILRIAFRQFYGMSDEDQYFKDAAVHATLTMSNNKELFYQAMVDSLNKAFSREVGATKDSNPVLKFEASADGITITEKEQDWKLGLESFSRVMFDIFPTTVYTNGEDAIWGKVEDVTPAKKDAVVGTNAIGNGRKIADMEWFYMGERGDQYRNISWPKVIPTAYLVDPTKEYNVLELHFAFTDTGVNSYRSEKDITIVAEDVAVINSIIGDINSKAGLSIATIGGGSSAPAGGDSTGGDEPGDGGENCPETGETTEP